MFAPVNKVYSRQKAWLASCHPQVEALMFYASRLSHFAQDNSSTVHAATNVSYERKMERRGMDQGSETASDPQALSNKISSGFVRCRYRCLIGSEPCELEKRYESNSLFYLINKIDRSNTVYFRSMA